MCLLGLNNVIIYMFECNYKCHATYSIDTTLRNIFRISSINITNCIKFTDSIIYHEILQKLNISFWLQKKQSEALWVYIFKSDISQGDITVIFGEQFYLIPAQNIVKCCKNRMLN